MFLASCGGRVANPIPIYRPGDDQRNCTGLKAEIAQLDVDMQRLLPKTDKTGTNVACGVAGAFLIVPWFFMDFKGADKIEFDAMRNRYNYLVSIAAEKQCSLVGVKTILSDKEMKKQLAAENKEANTIADNEFRKCGNCGNVMGNLEKPYTFEKHIVCKDCYDKLTAHADAEK